MDINRHVGKLAIVTGAGSGIGQAIAMRLVGEGARVIACDVNAAGLQSTAALVESGDLRTCTADVTLQSDVDRIIATAGGTVDILINNAGIMDHFVPLSEVDDALWNRVMDVNVNGVMRLTRAVLPGMIEVGHGAIVTVASEASLRAGASGVAYTTSKHAVLGLVKHVAFFYGPKGVRSNAVLPGAVATGIGASAAPLVPWAMERAMAGMATMGAVAQPDQLAAAASWLASDEASNVNGALMTCDGGWSAA